MSYFPHQLKAADATAKLLQEHGLAAIWGLPRTGKSRTSLRAAELNGAESVLILTKKAAILGWESEIKAAAPSFEVTIKNYEQAKNITGEFDLAIIDESHNLGKRGKPTNRVKEIRKLCYHLPCIFLSGTPTIETQLGIYHQFVVTKHSPFGRFKNFYDFFNTYGIPDPVWIGGRSVMQYKKSRDTLAPLVEKYAVRIDQDDAGIKHKAQDVIHRVMLEESTKTMIKDILKEGVFENFYFDTDIGCRSAAHQIESGAILFEDKQIMLPNIEVVDYLKRHFGDTEDVAYFTHYRSTREKLRRHFKKATLLSSVAHAEGFDASQFKHVVLVNTAFSGAKFAQVRERATNINRTTECLVHHIVCENAVSAQVYEAVSQKKDFNLAAFRRFRA